MSETLDLVDASDDVPDAHSPRDAATGGDDIDWWGMLTDPGFLSNPYPDLARIREMGAVHLDPVSGIYFVTRSREFSAMAKTPDMGRDTRFWADGWNSPRNRQRDPDTYELFKEFQPQMINANAPDHRRTRSVYDKAFRPGDMTRYLPMMEDECRKLLDALPEGEPFDFMTALANPLPHRISLRLFDIPAEMDETIAKWIAALSWVGNIVMTPEQKREAASAQRDFKAWVRGHLAERSADPGNGLIAISLAAAATGAMNEDETLNNVAMLISGSRTTLTLLGNGMLTLLRNPAQFEKLRANRGLMRTAIEEMLRYEPGSSIIPRAAVNDFQCGATRIPAGALAIGLVGAINRDPERFDNPDVFDITRNPNHHSAFGGGPHICIGKALARMATQIAFNMLMDRPKRSTRARAAAVAAGTRVMAQVALAAAPEINWWGMLTDPAYLANPHAELRRIRELGPVHRDEFTGIYFVLGHSEFRQMAMAPEMGRDTRLWTNGWSRPGSQESDPVSYCLFSEFHRQMVNADPPDHRRMRDVYEKAFRPGQMAQLVPMIQAECQQLVDALPVDAPVDFMTAFANHLPLRVSRNLFGIPADMDEQLAIWNAALIKIGDIMMPSEQKRDALDALRAYKAYLKGHLESCRDRAGDSFIGLAAAALADGTMDEEETLNNLLGLVSGNETTVTLLGNGLLALLRNPAELHKLRSNPDLMRPAIEEMLRYEPSINFILRVAIQDYRCGDVVIPAGSLAIGLVGAINRDPARFQGPDVFDIARQPNAQSIFGGGPHVCIGAALARLEAQTAFAALLERFPRIELAGEPVWWADRTNQRGLETLPLKFG